MGVYFVAVAIKMFLLFSVPPVEVDYIVCGLCQRDFPLANIMSFMQHKKFDCDDYRDYQGKIDFTFDFEYIWSLDDSMCGAIVVQW